MVSKRAETVGEPRKGGSALGQTGQLLTSSWPAPPGICRQGVWGTARAVEVEGPIQLKRAACKPACVATHGFRTVQPATAALS